MLCTTLEYHLLIALPLWILSVIFHHLLPLAIASLLLPVGVCTVAGAQAALPRNRIKWWSRPLVAILFFLQPLVRGGARYRGRLALRPSPLASHQSLDSLALRTSHEALKEVRYWSANRMDRLEFVAAILQRLDREGWARSSDIGWSEYDLEIYGSRWSQLQLTTVSEEHPQNNQLIRCRLRTSWTLAARMTFGSLLALELLLIGLIGAWRPWSWLLLLTLPIAAAFLWFDQRNLRSVVVALLDTLARELNLTKLPQQTEPQPTTTGTGPTK